VNGAGVPGAAGVVAPRGISGGEHKQNGLRPRAGRQGVPNRGVATGGSQVVVVVIGVVPTIVRNEGIGLGGLLLQISVGDRCLGRQGRGDGEEPGGRRFAAKLQVCRGQQGTGRESQIRG